MRMSPDADESIRCSASGCSCVCFQPGSVQLRSCDRCGHGWVTHALEKLHFQAQQPSSCGPVEVALPGLVFDLSSLVLYGAQAIPIRLKILLDRLFSILNPEQVGHILQTLGWSLGDYVRGYMLQFPGGKVLDRWLMVTPEEELLILKQFLRFGETRPIVELMALQCLAAVNHLSNPEPDSALKNGQSEISTFIERSGGALRNARGMADVCYFKKNVPVERGDTVHLFENVPVGHCLLPPFHFPASTFHCLAPPTKQELLPPSKLTTFLRKPSGTRDEGRQEGRRVKDGDLTQQPPDGELPLKIKAEPEKSNLAPPIRRQELRLHKARQENTSSLPPSFSSSLHPSPPASSSYSLNPLPSFSSSFLCPLPTSSSPLRPLPSALCSLPPAAGGRKGRVCCGVCGKSFYDKGTLKIHYNAVHLKIKHRCTVAGCAMVFSSLRSRNRHSANPNPRLHTGAGRDTHTHRNTHSETHTNTHSNAQTHKDKSAHTNVHSTHTGVCRDTFWQQDDEGHTHVRLHTQKNGCNGHTNLRYGSREDTPPAADPPPTSGPQTLNQSFTLSGSAHRSVRHPQAPPPPPLLPACNASSLDSPSCLDPLEKTERCQNLHTHQVAPAPPPGPALRNSPPVSRDDGVTEDQRGEACVSPPTNQQQRWESSDPTPKKKSRKSSTPVKIEREKVEVQRNEEEEES